MEQVSFTTVSSWSISEDAGREAKFAFLRQEVERRFPPEQDSSGAVAQFIAFLEANDAYKFSNHFLRYVTTFGAMLRSAPDLSGQTILETGGACPILAYLAQGNACHQTESDLRLEIDAPDEFADILFSFEVVEHIKDMPEKSIDEAALFSGTGIRNYVSEIHRVLKPGGLAFVTTPNAASLRVLENLLAHKPPMVFRPHVREYTKSELEDLFAAFEIVDFESQYNFFNVAASPAARVKLFEALGVSTQNRGDDHFFCLRKKG